MAVTAKKGKKLFQIAKELNLATETIKEFLEKKGVKVGNPNLRISAEVYDLILERFSFEKKEAEKIQRRRDEKTREEMETAAEAALEQAAAAAAAEETATAEEPVETTAAAEAIAENGTAETVAAAEDVAAATPVEEETPVSPSPQSEESEEQTEAEAEPESKPSEEIAAPPAAAATSPRVGDIITDHPVAKEFLARQEREKVRKKERAEKKSKSDRRKKSATEETPVEQAAPVPVLPGEISATTLDETKILERRKERKKNRQELQEEKDARRRKAFEMVRKEGKKIRPQLLQLDDVEAGAEVPTKEKEGRKRRQKKRKEVDQKEVDSSVKKTLAEMRDAGTAKRKRRKTKTSEEEEILNANVIKVTEFITTQALANLLDVSPTEIIRKCLELGLVVTINQRLDMDTIRLLAEEFGCGVEEEEEFGSEYLEDIAEEEDDPADMQPRAPVVTVMGHVDHGKTSLLDYIRKSNVVAGESGGITQHIGASVVQVDEKRKITFLDTPGHEAFTAMRARGAQVTDIVVLVIAADDKVMPQTEEALDHAKAAGVSIVIAINKMDRPGANPEAIRKQLADRNILVEEWGGKYQCVEVSAKTGQNIPELLEKILLEAELLDLKANPARRARGVVLEARLDRGKGPVATALVEKGTLHVGDNFVVGQHSGRVRAMLNFLGQRVESAGPSTPVQILGIDGVPEAGDHFIVMADEQETREISQRRQQLKREQDFRQVRLMTLDELSKQIKAGDVKELRLLVKADVDGSAQALMDSLQKLSTESVEVQVIRRAVGPIAESDVILAAASTAIIIGFNVRATLKAREMAAKENVDIRLYKVIYDAIEDVERALEGMLEPIEREVVTGTLEVREVFKISRIGTIAGCAVLSGKVHRNSKVRLVRNDVEIYDGKLSSLKRFKDDVKEVQSGYECGLSIENFNDIKQGDIIEAYEVVLEAQTLVRSAQR